MNTGPIWELAKKEKVNALISCFGPFGVTWLFFAIWNKTPILKGDAQELSGLLISFLCFGLWFLWMIDKELAPYKDTFLTIHKHRGSQDPAIQRATAEYLKGYTERLVSGHVRVSTGIHALWEIEFLEAAGVGDFQSDVRKSLRTRVESLCNSLARAEKTSSYFATENMLPSTLNADDNSWWNEHAKVLHISGVKKENRHRLLVLSYADFANELNHYKGKFVDYLKKNVECETDLRLMVYTCKNHLAGHFPHIPSWNYAIYGGLGNGSSKAFIHYPNNTIVILSDDVGVQKCKAAQSEAWRNANNRSISDGLFVSGSIKDITSLERYSEFLKTYCGAVPQQTCAPAQPDCWAHSLVGVGAWCPYSSIMVPHIDLVATEGEKS